MSDMGTSSLCHDDETWKRELDRKVLARLRAPFGCEFIDGARPYWRIHDANDDAVASVAPKEEGYARLIVDALNRLFEVDRGS
jgi:hypothetical protein